MLRCFLPAAATIDPARPDRLGATGPKREVDEPRAAVPERDPHHRRLPGRGRDGSVLLDLRHLGAEQILERLHGTRDTALTYAGIDPIRDPIPVRPGAHYHMGGVDADAWGKTELDGVLIRR